jgi:hypothetical protein
MKEFSRGQLYALGETFGEDCTRREGGRVIYGGGSSKSSSASTTNTTNTDRRVALQSGVGISSSGGTVNVQALDGAIVQKALDVVGSADATSGEGFAALLGLADKLFTGAGSAINAQQTTTLETLKTINTAANDQKGAIDQKTMIVLAISGAAALAFVASRKGK